MPTPSIQIVNVDGALSKRCPKCKTIKPLTDFSADQSKNCGYSVWCKLCSRGKFAKYYKANREHDKASSQAWRAENRDWSREISADWKARNPDRVRDTQAAHCRTTSGRFVRMRACAKSRGIVFQLTLPAYQSMIEGKVCHYCEGSLNETGGALDRKDSSLGYTVENCVPCCGDCNLIKHGILTYEEMLAVAKLLKEMRNA